MVLRGVKSGSLVYGVVYERLSRKRDFVESRLRCEWSWMGSNRRTGRKSQSSIPSDLGDLPGLTPIADW